jgi:hypothetical protein
MVLSSSAQEKSPPVRLDDYFYDGGPWLFWSSDGQCVFTNAATEGRRKSPFSIVQYRPSAKAREVPDEHKVRVLQKGRSLVTLCELAPGLLSAASLEDGKAFTVDAEADKATPMAQPLLLLDRRGEVGLFADLGTRKLCTAKITTEEAPPKGKP